MKLLTALVVFVLTFATTIKSVANESAHEAATCTAETNDKNCSSVENHDTAKSSHAEHGEASKEGHHSATAAKDWSHKRQSQVSAIMPEKEQNPTQIIRPTKVKLLSPQFLAKVSGTSVKLEWSEATGAKVYHVQVSKDAGFNNRSMYVADDKWVKGTSFEVKDLEPGIKYFWRVAAVNPDQDSTYIKSLFESSAFETK